MHSWTEKKLTWTVHSTANISWQTERECWDIADLQRTVCSIEFGLAENFDLLLSAASPEYSLSILLPLCRIQLYPNKSRSKNRFSRQKSKLIFPHRCLLPAQRDHGSDKLPSHLGKPVFNTVIYQFFCWQGVNKINKKISCQAKRLSQCKI